jgi:hypothetical protein
MSTMGRVADEYAAKKREKEREYWRWLDGTVRQRRYRRSNVYQTVRTQVKERPE